METVIAAVVVVLIGLLLAVLAVAWIVRSPFVYGQFQDVIADMNHENQELRRELADTDGAIRELRREMQRAELQIDRLQQYAEDAAAHSELLAARLRALGHLDIPPTPQPPPRQEALPVTPRPVSDTAALARRVAAAYSLEEIDTLALELQLDGALTGETLENRAASLVKAALRRGILSELVTIARRDRPRGGF